MIDGRPRVRRAIHQGMRAEAIAIVEERTQRHVVGYLTAQDDDPDRAILVFHLARPKPTASQWTRLGSRD
jgi:hypothetical protein